MPVRGLYITSEWHSMVALHNPRTGILWELHWLPHYPHYHRIKISNRRATQRCNVSAFFYAEICSLLARRRSSQPVGRWRPTCVMRHARGPSIWIFILCHYPREINNLIFGAKVDNLTRQIKMAAVKIAIK